MRCARNGARDATVAEAVVSAAGRYTQAIHLCQLRSLASRWLVVLNKLVSCSWHDDDTVFNVDLC